MADVLDEAWPSDDQAVSKAVLREYWKLINEAFAAAGGGGALELSDLTDVSVSTPTNRNVLVADGATFVSRALLEADISDLAAYAAAVHTHVAADITDFAEALDDRVNALLVEGANITLTYDDIANTLTITGAAGSGAVDSVFTRTGAVVAALNDYAASLINNDSTVAGATVDAALDALLGSINTLTPSAQEEPDNVNWTYADALGLFVGVRFQTTLTADRDAILPAAQGSQGALVLIRNPGANTFNIRVRVEDPTDLGTYFDSTLRPGRTKIVRKNASGTDWWSNFGIEVAYMNQYELLGRTDAGFGEGTGLGADNIAENLTPAAGNKLLGFASGIAGAAIQLYDVDNLPGNVGDAAPSIVNSTGTPHVLAAAQRDHLQVSLHSHAASVDFEVPTTAAAGDRWVIYADHASCTVSINSDAGSVNGVAGAAREIAESGVAVVDVESNPGSAPVVTVSGNVFEPAASRGATNPVVKSDHGREFTITGSQTFGAVAANYPNGFTATYWASGASRDLVGLDATHSVPDGGAATVKRNAAGALVAVGSGGTTVLDAA